MRFRSQPLSTLSLLLCGILCVLHTNAWAETGDAQANPLAAPADVAAAPADAQRTVSGLAYQVLKKGTGTVHPSVTASP